MLALTSAAGLARAQESAITVQGDARPAGELAAEPYAASSRLKRERVSAPALRAPELLRSEAGVQISEAGGLGAPATASIRGATSAQTPVYLGGVRLNDAVGGVADLSSVPLWLVDHVDVYRGNAPFGADALGMGGAVYFEPRRPRKEEAAAGLTFGSFGTRAGFGYVSLGDDRLGAIAGLSAERAENDYEFADNRGTLFSTDDDARRARMNADSRVRDAWLVARARPTSRSRFELLANTVTREQGAPKLALVPSRRARAELDRGLAALSARVALGSAGQHTLGLKSLWLDATSRLLDPERELGALTGDTSVRGRRLEQQATLDLDLGSRFRAELAAAGGLEDLARRDGAGQTSVSATLLRGAGRLGFAATPALTLFGIVSSECWATEPGADGCQHAQPTGRLGAGWRARGATLFLNLSRYLREPALGELYGAGIVVRGNPQLRPEIGLAVDMGARAEQRWGDFSLHAASSAFARSAQDLISYARTAQGYVVPLNVSSARVLGLELEAGTRAFERVELDVSATLLDPRDTTEGRRLENDFLPFSSRLVLSPRLLVTTGERPGSALHRADLGVELVYLSNRFADAAGLIVIPEQTSLGATTTLVWLSGSFITRARLGNALDAQRFDIVGYPLPGRSVYVSAEVWTP